MEDIQENSSSSLLSCVYKNWSHPRLTRSLPQRNIGMVWNETARIVNDLFETLWDGRDVVTVEHCLDITLPVGLLFPIHYKLFESNRYF